MGEGNFFLGVRRTPTSNENRCLRDNWMGGVRTSGDWK